MHLCVRHEPADRRVPSAIQPPADKIFTEEDWNSESTVRLERHTLRGRGDSLAHSATAVNKRTFGRGRLQLEVGAYRLSKRLAEQAAWRLVREQTRDKPVELAVINPSFVLGPPFSTRTDSTSISVAKRLIEGAFAVRQSRSHTAGLALSLTPGSSKTALRDRAWPLSMFATWHERTSKPCCVPRLRGTDSSSRAARATRTSS